MEIKPLEREENKESKGEEAPTSPTLQIDPKIISLAKKFGIDLNPFIEAAVNQEMRITRLEGAIGELGVKLAPLVAAIERSQTAQANQTQPGLPMLPGAGGKLDMGTVMQFLNMVGGSGGGDSEMSGLGKELIRAQIESIKASAIARQEEGTVLSAIGKQVLTRMVSKQVKDVTDK